MIDCEVIRKNGVVTEFTITGHAGMAEAGEDIVCAGVSSIVYGAVGALEDMFGITSFDAHVSPDDYLRFVLPAEYLQQSDSITNNKVSAILDAMVIGLKQIELSYGDYVRVKERRC